MATERHTENGPDSEAVDPIYAWTARIHSERDITSRTDVSQDADSPLAQSRGSEHLDVRGMAVRAYPIADIRPPDGIAFEAIA